MTACVHLGDCIGWQSHKRMWEQKVSNELSHRKGDGQILRIRDLCEGNRKRRYGAKENSFPKWVGHRDT